MKDLEGRLEELSVSIEKMKLAEYVNLLNNPMRLLWINFISGVARGVGMAIGFTLLGAVLIYFLQKIVLLNLPLISDFVADIVQMVMDHYKARY